MVHLLVQLLSLLSVLMVCAFVYLRLHGMPEPILRAIIRQVNAAGIPIDMDELTLTLRGWRATNVRYYSRHPDDILPILEADAVLLDRRVEVHSEETQGWLVDIEASGVLVNPSAEWGIGLVGDVPDRNVDALRLCIGFFQDRIEFSEGEMDWLGIRFLVDGTLLKKETVKKETGWGQAGVDVSNGTQRSQTYLSEERMRLIKEWLKDFSIHGDAVVDIDFSINPNQMASSRLDIAMHAEDAAYRNVGIDRIELVGSYLFPELSMERLAILKDGDALLADGRYDVRKGEIEGHVENGIVSKDALLLLPDALLGRLSSLQFSFEKIPRFSFSLGPAKPTELLEKLSGSFSLQGMRFYGLAIESVSGDIERGGRRLEFSKINALVAGQENRASGLGSGLVGGSAEGSVFWDADTQCFGVAATGSFDPNLLLQPLSMVEIATNVIRRFRFPEQPPQFNLELGACYADWRSFFMDLSVAGESVGFHDAHFSTVNGSSHYTNGVLTVKPLVVTRGADYAKGWLELDFRNSTARFDASGNIGPAVIEDAVCSGFNLFGAKIRTGGPTKIEAAGTLDWGRMLATDFTADVETEKMDLPIVSMDNFKARITGKGPCISVHDATFGLYGGSARGSFEVSIDPGTNALPYTTDFNVQGSNFRSFLAYLNPDMDNSIAGCLSGAAYVEADLMHAFCDSANGTGSIAVVEGQLADLPLFSGFSRLVRRVVPGFKIFSITSLRGNFLVDQGTISSQNAYFDGDVISAKGSGSYNGNTGFDAKVQVQVFSENRVSKVIRTITSPISKLFELHLGGTLSDPSWRLDHFSSDSRDSLSQEKPDSD